MARIRTRTLERTNEAAEKAAAAERHARRREIEEEEEEIDEAELGVTAPKDRPTPSMRDARPRWVGSTGLINRIPVIRSIVAYLRGVANEMQKVTWPDREETRRLTTIVLLVTIAFSIALGLFDSFFSWWFRQAFHADSEMVFLGVAAAVVILVSGGYFALRHRV